MQNVARSNWIGLAASHAPTLIDVVTDPDAFPPITAFEGRLADKG